jgi:hypothetical protein
MQRDKVLAALKVLSRRAVAILLYGTRCNLLENEMPGYGDCATWGPVTGPNDPRYVEFCGDVYFKCQIGEDFAEVQVWGNVSFDELEVTSVEYNGCEVLPILSHDTILNICQHYERNSEAINNRAIAKAKEYDE